MTNSSVGFPQFYQIQQILDRFLEKDVPFIDIGA
ncbi:transposase, partial [Lactiplantibacillus pentosus]|nr:transposase [Lactiplantibacillus pentosus]MBU7475642.1 transposase [Lactiplantibacillus pentosus]MBU7514508.1 transposase [Lactiplantibacillus pentosus]MBU7527600.1 transposase [Lactiplantibacillus pentosus]MBU7530896.1 transposase [Lactiplantibacillus pentosus]